MKLKFKSSWIGIALIAIMLFSTFASAVIQSFNSGNKNIQVPTSNIVDYKLDPQLADALLQNGATIVTFEYNLGCKNCIQQKYDLEYLANQYENQIFLEELVNTSLDVSKTHIVSIYSEENLVDANSTGIFGALCNAMVSPPPECAVRQ